MLITHFYGGHDHSVRPAAAARVSRVVRPSAILGLRGHETTYEAGKSNKERERERELNELPTLFLMWLSCGCRELYDEPSF